MQPCLIFAYVPQPSSQALSPLPLFVVRRKTLVAAAHVTTSETNVSTGVGTMVNYPRNEVARL